MAAIIAVAVVLFVWNKLPVVVVAMGTALALYASGILSLEEALRTRRIAGAGLDVFHQEPVSSSSGLLSLDNVVLSPHSAGHSYEGWFRRARFAWENIGRIAAGEAPLSLAR